MLDVFILISQMKVLLKLIDLIVQTSVRSTLVSEVYHIVLIHIRIPW